MRTDFFLLPLHTVVITVASLYFYSAMLSPRRAFFTLNVKNQNLSLFHMNKLCHGFSRVACTFGVRIVLEIQQCVQTYTHKQMWNGNRARTNCSSNFIELNKILSNENGHAMMAIKIHNLQASACCFLNKFVC